MRALRIGEDVVSPTGEVIGVVERLVVDPVAHRITHLVVEGRLVDRSRVAGTDPDRIRTDLDRAGLEALTPVADAQARMPDGRWTPPAGFALEHFLTFTGALLGQAPYVPPVHLETDLQDVHEITEGSPVWYGTHHLGEVSRVLTEEDEIVELVVRRDQIRGGFARLPIGHVVELVGNNVHVDVDAEALAALPRYEEG